MSDIFARLAAPFPPEAVSWRVGSTTQDKSKGMALAFIDARDVMDRLDDVCGPGGWQCRYPHANGKTVCDLAIKVDGEWVWKSDGAGDTDYEAEKGALSDAFKRAAVRWGIGRYLYALPSPWVAVKAAGKSYKIEDHELEKLRKLLGTHAGAEPVHVTTMTEGKDWFGVKNPQAALSAHAAKGKGLDKAHDEFRQKIAAAASQADWKAVCGEFHERLCVMPLSWRIEARADADLRAEELGFDPTERRAA